MFSFVKQRISLKITLTLLVVLATIFALLSWTLITSRKDALEQELFAKGQMAALVGASTFGNILEEMLDSGHFSQTEIFDENYQKIIEGSLAGSDIPKYHTAYDRYLDERIRPLEDAFLNDEMVVYAVLVDRNGYLPTHNSRYSQPLVGDPDQDRVGNRTKRIFDDPVGLAAARYVGGNGSPILKQVYPRDTGVIMWDLSAPVFVKGQHWGAFRIGFSMEATEASVAELRNTIILASLGSLVLCAMLTLLSVSKFTRPLLLLAFAVKTLGRGGRQEKIDLYSEDEVGVLVSAFNQMSESLEKTTVSRDFYDMLLQSMNDLLIVSDPDGSIVSVNRATCDVLGFSESHVLTHKVQELVKLTDSDEDWFADHLPARLNYTADVVLVNCNGDQFPMAMSASCLQGTEKKRTGYIFTFQNNSERIAAEEATYAAFEKAALLNRELQDAKEQVETQHQELADAYEKLKNSQVQILQQEKMASIGQLAAGVAHEINNPMGFITSNLGSLGKYLDRLNNFLEQQNRLIGEKVSADDQQEIKAERKKLKIDFLIEDSRDLLEESMDGADRVKAIVQNLKSFSRLDQEEEHAADLNECLDSTINIAWNELKYKVTLEKDYSPLPALLCYPQQLNQVFMNLLVNAAQAIESKGIIKIRTWAEADNIYIEIADNGSGIPEDNLQKIFEPFFTTKEVGKGTGLGMSISYEIIKEHQGDISVESVVGEGTTFTIRLPLKKKAEVSG